MWREVLVILNNFYYSSNLQAANLPPKHATHQSRSKLMAVVVLDTHATTLRHAKSNKKMFVHRRAWNHASQRWRSCHTYTYRQRHTNIEVRVRVYTATFHYNETCLSADRNSKCLCHTQHMHCACIEWYVYLVYISNIMYMHTMPWFMCARELS